MPCFIQPPIQRFVAAATSGPLLSSELDLLREAEAKELPPGIEDEGGRPSNAPEGRLGEAEGGVAAAVAGKGLREMLGEEAEEEEVLPEG